MRTLSLSLVLVSLVVGCAHTLSDAPSGYPGFPAGPSSPVETSPARAARALAKADARDRLAPPAPEPRTFEPKLVPLREIAPREPPHRTDFIECWQCRR